MPDRNPGRRQLAATALAVALLPLLAAVVGRPAFAAAGDRVEQTVPPAQTVRFVGLEAPVPPGWRRSTPTSTMRLAQFAYASGDDRLAAELIFYYFGPRQGGSAEANIARWRSQFRAADGSAPQPRIDQLTAAGHPITRVKLEGSYARGVGAGPGGTGRPGQTLVAALVQTPQGQVTIQLHGDTVLVDRLEAGFDDMLRGIRPHSDR